MTETPMAPPSGARRLIVMGLVTVFAAGVVYVFYRGFGSDPREVPFKLSGKPAPAFTLTRLDNDEQVTLAQFRGRPVVLNFWSTWCGPCRQEHPVLQWAGREFGDQVVFLGVVFEDTAENARQFLAQNGSPFTQLHDPKSSMAVDYGVTGVPETYFIDRQGIIVGKVAMPIDPKTMASAVRAIIGSDTQARGTP